MSGKDRQVKSIVLLEGQVRWIMERDTPEERLAAWETLAAIAFPNDYELPYQPPELPSDGSPLSPCDRVRRDTYYMLCDFFSSRLWEQTGRIKDQKKVAAGKRGAAARFGMYWGSDSTAVAEEPPPADSRSNELIESPQPIPIVQMPTLLPKDLRAEETEYFSDRLRKIGKGLTEVDKKKIAEWHKKFPNAAALREWLDRNFLYQNRNVVCTKEFAEFAYTKLALEENWVSYKTGHAMKDIRNAIHWIALDYIRKSREIRRVEEEEHRKDLESEFETKSLVASQMSNEDITALERKRRRQAEREAMEKVLRGEL